MACAHAPLEVHRTLPVDETAPKRARDLVEEATDGCRTDVVEDAKLLVSELVSNVVRHGRRTELDLTVKASSTGGIRVEVANAAPTFSFRKYLRGSGRVSGWGLEIVDKLAARWGVDSNHLTSVWFELDPA